MVLKDLLTWQSKTHQTGQEQCHTHKKYQQHDLQQKTSRNIIKQINFLITLDIVSPVCVMHDQYPERELHRAVVGLEAHRSSLLQDGLVSSMQALPHHWDGVGVVTGLLVVVGRLVGIVLILLLVS